MEGNRDLQRLSGRNRSASHELGHHPHSTRGRKEMGCQLQPWPRGRVSVHARTVGRRGGGRRRSTSNEIRARLNCGMRLWPQFPSVTHVRGRELKGRPRAGTVQACACRCGACSNAVAAWAFGLRTVPHPSSGGSAGAGAGVPEENQPFKKNPNR
eukprot:5006727-Prymnesium_polylepis.2